MDDRLGSEIGEISECKICDLLIIDSNKKVAELKELKRLLKESYKLMAGFDLVAKAYFLDKDEIKEILE